LLTTIADPDNLLKLLFWIAATAKKGSGLWLWQRLFRQQWSFIKVLYQLPLQQLYGDATADIWAESFSLGPPEEQNEGRLQVVRDKNGGR
jgi:hypothetical protein